MGRTAAITIAPGRAATDGLRAEAPPQAPGAAGKIPADRTSDAGIILDAQTITTAGRATSRY